MFSFQRFRVAALGRRRQTVKKISARSWKKPLLGLAFLLLGTLLLRKQIVLVLLNVLAFTLSPILPDIDSREALYASQSTIIYDREGGELYTIHGDENRFEIPLEKMPDSVIYATIAAEDDDFFNHPGFDVDGITAALLSELGIGPPRGGSTITQQFVKNAYLSPERSYWRKLQELLLAVKLENRFSKNEILELYLNRIPYGSNAYGIEAAAQTFFGKVAEDLTLAESAILAGLPQAPSRYSPYSDNRTALTGVCGDPASGTVLPESGELTLELTATGKVWLRVLTDGKQQKEWTAKAGESVAFTFTGNFQVVSGNNNFTLAVNGAELSPPQTKNLTLARAEIPALLATDATVVLTDCDSPADPDYSPGRKDYVLNRMLALDFIDQAEYDTAWQETFGLIFQPYREPIRAPHFVFFVRDLLEEQYGKDLVERGGLRVFTTLNPVLQKAAEEFIMDSFPHDTDADGNPTAWSYNSFGATNASLLAIENQTGQIITMVGSRDYFEVLDENGYGNDGAVNLTTRPRQPGSSFKPFAYTAGFLAGYSPATVLWDVETKFGSYEPANYDGEFQGPLSVRRAIGGSRNLPAVKMAILVGEKAIVELAQKMGLSSLADDERYGPTIGLGTGEVPMLEMVTGYSTFARSGLRITPTPILKITDSQGNIIKEYEKPLDPEQVLDPVLAYLMTHILSDPGSRPAGWNGYLNLPSRPNAAKTGTANKRISEEVILPGDTWTIGYTPQLTAAAWVGNNDGSPMGVLANGLASASPIWNKFMKVAHSQPEYAEVQTFAVPEGIVQRSVSKLTGKIPAETTPADQIVVETFAKWAVPLGVDDAFTTLTIDAASGLLPTEFTPESALTTKTFVNLHSLQPGNPAWETPVQEWLVRQSNNEESEFKFEFEPPPTELDNVHTAETARFQPSISIVSPISGSTTRKGAIGVWVDVSAGSGVEKVEYYRDDELVATATAAPWKGTVVIPVRASTGDRFLITAKVYDKLYYADTSSVEIIVGTDTQAPTVRITTPRKGEKITRGTTLLASAEAFDAGGDVKQVVFEFDGQTLATLTEPPYETPLIIRTSTALGTHRLRVTATDTDGRTTRETIEFEVVIGDGGTTDLSVISPASGTTIQLGTASVTIIAQLDRAKILPAKVEIIAKNQTTGDRRVIATLENPAGETFSVSWTDFTPGSYELYLKVRDDTGKTYTSGRNTVRVE